MKRSKKTRGLLVALEGIDGAGKTTLARPLAAALRRRGLSVHLRYEPSDARLGAIAQSVSRTDPWTGAVYFTVDRHVARPALERALARFDVVLTDRSFYSTLAYQGSALRPQDRVRIAELERAATREPDRVLLLDLPPHDALARLGRRRTARGPLEEQRVLARVARAYRRLAREGGWTVLDSRAPVAELLPRALEGIGVGRTGRHARRRRA